MDGMERCNGFGSSSCDSSQRFYYFILASNLPSFFYGIMWNILLSGQFHIFTYDIIYKKREEQSHQSRSYLQINGKFDIYILLCGFFL